MSTCPLPCLCSRMPPLCLPPLPTCLPGHPPAPCLPHPVELLPTLPAWSPATTLPTPPCLPRPHPVYLPPTLPDLSAPCPDHPLPCQICRLLPCSPPDLSASCPVCPCPALSAPSPSAPCPVAHSIFLTWPPLVLQRRAELRSGGLRDAPVHRADFPEHVSLRYLLPKRRPP